MFFWFFFYFKMPNPHLYITLVGGGFFFQYYFTFPRIFKWIEIYNVYPFILYIHYYTNCKWIFFLIHEIFFFFSINIEYFVFFFDCVTKKNEKKKNTKKRIKPNAQRPFNFDIKQIKKKKNITKKKNLFQTFPFSVSGYPLYIRLLNLRARYISFLCI